jgi:hypothetical protein
MYPPHPDMNQPGEPTAASDLLFRIPLWMDISIHLLPAIALVIGTSIRFCETLDE